MWTPVEEIKWTFGLDDFKEPIRLIRQILRGTDPVSQYLLTVFHPDNLGLFQSVDGPLGQAFHNPIVSTLIVEFDKILASRVFYDPARFADIKLSVAANQLIERSLNEGDRGFLDEEEQTLLNRMLLEAAYPDEIVRSGKIKELAAEIVNFFAYGELNEETGETTYKTINDFLDACWDYHHDEHPDLGFEIRMWCHNLIAEGLLYPAGFDPTQRVPYNERFMSAHFSREMAVYGSYEFVAFGFRKVIKHFANSVIRLLISDSGKEHIATGFLIDDDKIITAAHCLPEGSTIKLEGWDAAKSPLLRIVTIGAYKTDKPFVLEGSNVDIALLEFESDPFPDKPKFKLWADSVLDKVLVLGYPPLYGFSSGLIASSGEIISKEVSTARNQPLIIFSASVKRGYSGGPVINRYGKVVGIVTNLLPSEVKDIGRLGYGLATPAQLIFDLINLAKGRQIKDKDIYPIAFRMEQGSIEIKWS